MDDREVLANELLRALKRAKDGTARVSVDTLNWVEIQGIFDLKLMAEVLLKAGWSRK